MLQANKGPLIAESSDNIPPLPLGQAILVLLTCEDDIFADALSRGTSTADHASHALFSLTKALKQSTLPSLNAIMPIIFEEAVKSSRTLSYRIGKLLRWIYNAYPTAFIEYIKAESSAKPSKSRNRLFLGLTISLRLLLDNFISSGALFSQKSKESRKKAYLQSRNLKPSIIEDDDASLSDPLLNAFGALDPRDHTQIISLFDIADPIIVLANESAAPETKQLTVLSAACLDTVLSIILFIIRIKNASSATSDREEVDDFSLGQPTTLPLVSPTFVSSLLSSLYQILSIQSIGNTSIRPFYSFLLDVIGMTLQRDAPYEDSDAIASLYATLDLWVPVVIEDFTFLPIKQEKLGDTLAQVMRQADPLLQLLKDNAAPRRRLLAALETLERILITISLVIGKSGPKKLRHALESAEIASKLSQIILPMITNASSNSVSSIEIILWLIQHLEGVLPDTLKSVSPVLASKIYQSKLEFCGISAINVVNLFANDHSALKMPLRAALFCSDAALRTWILRILREAVPICLKSKFILPQISLEHTRSLINVALDEAEKWDAPLIESLPLARLATHENRLDSTLKSFLTASLRHVAKENGKIEAFRVQTISDLINAAPELSTVLSTLLETFIEFVSNNENRSQQVTDFVRHIAGRMASDQAVALAKVLFTKLISDPTNTILVRLISTNSPIISTVAVVAEVFPLAESQLRSSFAGRLFQEDESSTSQVYLQLAPLLFLRVLDPKCFDSASVADAEGLCRCLASGVFENTLQDEPRKVAAEILARFALDQWWDQLKQFWTKNTTSVVNEAAKVAVFVLCNKVMIKSSEVERKFHLIWEMIVPILKCDSDTKNAGGASVLQRALIDFVALCTVSGVSRLSEKNIPVAITSLREKPPQNITNFTEMLQYIVDKLDLGRISSVSELKRIQETDVEIQLRVLLLNSLISASKLISDQKSMSLDGVPVIDVYGRIILPVLFEILDHEANYAMRGAYLQLVFSLSFHMKQSVLPFAAELRKTCLMALQDAANPSTRLSGLKLLGSTFAATPEVWEQDTKAFVLVHSLLETLAKKDTSPPCRQLASQLFQAVSIPDK